MTAGLPSLAHLQEQAPEYIPTWPDLRLTIEEAIDNQPRTLQTRIGPSELGISCDACLVSKLAGASKQDETSWLPFIGTAVHQQIQDIFLADEARREQPRWLAETTVSVGTVNGVDITGHADLFDLHTGTLTDWKIVGATTLRNTHKAGPTPTHRIQQHLYGRGFVRRGLTVTNVQIAYLPRNSRSLADAFIWSEPYDEAVALKALERAEVFATWLEAMGLDNVLKATGGHTGMEYDCRRYDPTIQRPGEHRETFSDLLRAV